MLLLKGYILVTLSLFGESCFLMDELSRLTTAVGAWRYTLVYDCGDYVCFEDLDGLLGVSTYSLSYIGKS